MANSTTEKCKLAIFTLFFFFMLISSALQSQGLKVGVSEYPPFVIKEPDGYRGISLDIWKLVSKHLKVEYELVPLGNNIYKNVQALQEGKIDILVGPVTATYPRILLANFTTPYALNRVGIVVPTVKISFMQLIFSIFLKIFTWTPIVVIAIILIYAHLFWYFERGKLKGIPSAYIEGIRYIIWSCLLRTKLPDIPSTLSGKFLHFFWLSVSSVILSVIYAAVVTATHGAMVEQKAKFSSDNFVGKHVVALEGGVGLIYAKKAGLKVTIVPDIATGFDMVLNHKADGYAEYTMTLLYYMKRHGLENQLMISPYSLKLGMFAFGLPFNSPWLIKINDELTFLEEFSLVSSICLKYIDAANAAYCL